MATKRIYVVTETNGEKVTKHLVKATNSSTAIRHVVEPKFTAELATQEDCIALAGEGVKVQEAGE